MDANVGKRVFFVSPRNTGRFRRDMEEYVKALEDAGAVVYWPTRDDDRACRDDDVVAAARHIAQMRTADEVHVWYYDLSQAVMFALGIAAALKKPVVVRDGPGRGDAERYSRLRMLVGRWNELLEQLGK